MDGRYRKGETKHEIEDPTTSTNQYNITRYCKYCVGRGFITTATFYQAGKTKCTVRKRVCLRAISELIPFWAKIPGNSVAQGISPEEASK